MAIFHDLLGKCLNCNPMFRRLSSLIPLLLALSLGVAACGQEDFKAEILGKWRITDPGGDLAGGTIEFRKNGGVTIIEQLRQGGTLRHNVFIGTYRFTDSDTVHMELSQSGGGLISRDVGVGIRKGWLTLHFGNGQIAYRRAG